MFCRTVICLETGIVYPSGRNCGQVMGIHSGSIDHVCKKQRHHAGGYSFAYA